MERGGGFEEVREEAETFTGPIHTGVLISLHHTVGRLEGENMLRGKGGEGERVQRMEREEGAGLERKEGEGKDLLEREKRKRSKGEGGTRAKAEA